MPELKTTERYTFSDYIYILFKWKKFLIINLSIVIILTTLYSFSIPKQYKATATIMIPPKQESGLSGLSSLLSNKSSLVSLGARAFGVSGSSEDVLLGIINSRSALSDVITKFNLMKYYEIKDNNMDKAIRAFKGDISLGPNDFGMIDFSVINKSPEESAEIANYMVSLVDSLNIKFNTERARDNRIFIEKRYKNNVKDLRNAENSLYDFQKKYGIVVVPQQLEVTVKAAADLESQLNKSEMQAYLAKQAYGENSPLYRGILTEVNLLKDKVNELKDSLNLSSTSNVLFPFKEMPKISIQYLKIYQELKIQQEIMEIIMPMYEQAKVEEKKSIPTVTVVDKAVPPELKYSPKKSVIIIGAFFLCSFFLIPFVFWADAAIMREQYKNPLQIKEANFFKKVVKIYRMKFNL